VNAFALTIGLSLVSAAAYAAAAVLQQRLAASLPSSSPFVVTLRHSRWWISVFLNVAGALLHAGALRYGPLTVVQPLGTLTLVVALPLGAWVGSRKVTRGERRGAGATVVGLTGLLALTAAAAPVHVLGSGSVLLVAGVTAAVLAAAVAIAARTSQPAAQALTFAAGAGVASGVASGLAQTVVVQVTQQGWSALLHPAVAVVLGLATSGLLLQQAAYRDSGLGAPLAMSTLANPIAAAAIGLTLLGEGYTAGLPGAGLAVVAAIVAGYGVAVLAHGTPAQDRRPERTRRPSLPQVPVQARRYDNRRWRAGSVRSHARSTRFTARLATRPVTDNASATLAPRSASDTATLAPRSGSDIATLAPRSAADTGTLAPRSDIATLAPRSAADTGTLVPGSGIPAADLSRPTSPDSDNTTLAPADSSGEAANPADATNADRPGHWHWDRLICPGQRR
jgi:hypothetical protein